MYDLLVKGGTVIDPAQEIHGQRDIAISVGKIAILAPDISPSETKKVIDARGSIVIPGLIDIHTHVAANIPIGVTPDRPGVLSGVTTVCDAGSTGYANFYGFRKLIIPHAQSNVFCFLHVCPTGQAVLPEICLQDINYDEMLTIIEENKDIVKGVKLRAGANVVENLGLDAVRGAKRLATEARLPIAVHIGIGLDETISDDKLNSFIREMLLLLDKGDILVHVYTPRKGGVIKPDGGVLPELREAMEKGVALDVAHGSGHFSFEVARRGIEQGILPTTLSSDVVATSIDGPVVYNLPVVMSKFLALGLSLDQVIERTTINPARLLAEEHRIGSLKVGMPADISVLDLNEGDFLFTDGLARNTLKGKVLLVPKLVLKSGVEIIPQFYFRNYIPGEQIHLPKGA